MKFEELLLDAGGFGRFQVFTLLLLAIPRTTIPLHFLLNNFLAVVPPHRCALPDLEGFGNLTEEELLLISIPREPDGTFSSCRMYGEPQWHLLENYTWGPPNNSTWRPSKISTWETPGASTCGPPNAFTVQSCQHGWTYDHSQFTSTIATQWDLVCEKKWLNKASSTFFFIGVTVGAIFIGYLSDRYGRRTMLLVCCVFTLLFEMAAAVSVNYLMFAIFRSLSGMSLSGFPIIIPALGVEWVDMKHHTLAGFLGNVWGCIGIMLLSLVAYLIRDWRWLLVAVTCPYIVAIISIWWLPESARWLLTKGKMQEAHDLLVRCSSMNGQAQLPPSINTEVLGKIAEEEHTDTHYSYFDLFRNPVLRKISICTGIVWFSMSFTYYGISLNISGFGVDMYLTQFIYGAIEMPFILSIYILMDKYGRRRSMAWPMLITGFSLGINVIIPVSLGALRTTVAAVGKGFSVSAAMAIFMCTIELYPTVLRQNGMGYNSFVSRIGVSVAPLTLLLDEVWKFLPQVIFSSAATVCGLVAFCLPETLNVQLPETVKDTEKARNESSNTMGNPQDVVRMQKF
ncbi:solute carrier family 22 member 7-like [Pleurodeles waltl]|uniref:solute carrier family 22 member 7-like n=1 Tax=Pleurodeles waltl TaxID=8319 RepID=UPI003709C4BB